MSNPSEVHEHFKKGENVMGDKIEFNEYRSAEWNARRWEKRMRRQLVMEKVMPFGIVVGTLVAFLILGYIEVGL